jgi:hypothetical protein
MDQPIPPTPLQSSQAVAVASATQMRTVSVLAPSDLPGGYTFFVVAANQSTFQVRVPPGGVRAGQTFVAEVVAEHSRGSD